ncbi:MAG TPA: BrnA antitoxin family protein [Bradyrhizobium sp.]|nr:BrnA antitoxin family protein [Bradyrhizobium sp.]
MTGSKRAIRSDLKKVDAHVIQPHEYDDAPELTDAQIASATVSVGLRPRGRPKSQTRKEAISLRVDADVLDAFKSTGDGWQTRMNGILRAAILPAARRPQKKSKRRHSQAKR